jgi:DNA adenine methylase
MQQYAFWDAPEKAETKIVNVAQIPQRSPFRYPGGKTWLVPHIRTWLRSLPKKPRNFVEPFLGGGIVSLTVAFEELAEEVTMVELDEEVAAVWETLLSDQDNDWLAQRVIEFDLTRETFFEEISNKAPDTKHRGFQTLLKNRALHGGILAPGSGVLKHGENGKGIKSRWYPETLRRRIQNIKHVSDKMTFGRGDGVAAIDRHASQKTSVFFIDPPYTAGKNGKRAGTRLYTHFELDHEHLFSRVERIKGDFLMTYDNADEVRSLAEKHGFEYEAVSMTNTHHATMTELVIGNNLSWLKGH